MEVAHVDGGLRVEAVQIGAIEQARRDAGRLLRAAKQQGHVPRVAVTHKRELRKLVVQLGKERLTLAREPKHADALASFCKHFGLEYRGGYGEREALSPGGDMSDMFTSTPVKKGENDEDDLYLVPSEIFEGGFNVSDVSDAEAAAAAAPADDVIPLSFDSSFEKSNSFVDEEIDSDFDDSIRVDYSDGSKDNSDLLDYKPQPGPRKVLPDISSSTDESSLSVYRVMLPRATIIGANSFDVKLAKADFFKRNITSIQGFRTKTTFERS